MADQTPVREPFHQALLANPRDPGPWQVYADYLEERGDPRGEWVRVAPALLAVTGAYVRRGGVNLYRIDEFDRSQKTLRSIPCALWRVCVAQAGLDNWCLSERRWWAAVALMGCGVGDYPVQPRVESSPAVAVALFSAATLSGSNNREFWRQFRAARPRFQLSAFLADLLAVPRPEPWWEVECSAAVRWWQPSDTLGQPAVARNHTLRRTVPAARAAEPTTWDRLQVEAARLINDQPGIVGAGSVLALSALELQPWGDRADAAAFRWPDERFQAELRHLATCL